MALIKVYRVEFLQDNPYGTFVIGDVLEMFVDTDNVTVPAPPLSFVTDGCSVELNGSPFAISAAYIIEFSAALVSVQEFNPQICSGTYLLDFGLYYAWPYINYFSLADHYSCTVNPPTCDLMIIGTPEVTPASDNVTADGSIVITATSTNSIEYKLDSDFIYGEGQSDVIFSGLLPGFYRVFARDSANCGVNILVEVTVNNTYSTKFRLEYTDYNYQTTIIDISRRGYIGSISEIKGAGNPFEVLLRGEGSDEKFLSLAASQAVLNLESTIDSQFSELYTNDPNLYRITYNKKTSSAETSISLPALSSWNTRSIDAGKPDWTTGATPSVINPGGIFPNYVATEDLYVDYSFIDGNVYTLNLTFTRVTNSGNFNPRTAALKIADSSFNIIFTATKGAIEGSNTVTINFTATASTSRIIFNYTSGSNVTITVTSTSGTTDGAALKGIYKVLPNQFIEDYKFPPYQISIKATDGLAELKTAYLIQPDGQKYFGTISLIKLVAFCLRHNKLNLNIRVACNLYADTMDQTDSDDPFEQAYIDYECFYLSQDVPSLQFVLSSILEPFCARITQWDGAWNIVRVEEMIADYDFREFDSEGEYIRNSEFSPVMDIEYPDVATQLLLSENNHSVETRPGYGAIKVMYKLGLKPNIFSNGDFRLRTNYVGDGLYSFSINKDGWTLVNAGYVINEAYELIDENNVAYSISSGFDTVTSGMGGEAYVQSDTYDVKMGTNNTIKITARCKVSRRSVYIGSTIYTVEVPYVKIRIRVKYGSQYLQADGTWSDAENILTFYTADFDKYNEYEVIAKQPTSGTPTAGQDFEVRVYHGYAFHCDYDDITDLEAVETWNGVDTQTIPVGYKTQLKVTGGSFDYVYYYELEENNSAASGFDIVRPDDYTVSSNERQWILKEIRSIVLVLGTDLFPFSIDYIKGEFLTGGSAPVDTVVRKVLCEAANPYTLEKELIIGSDASIVVTEASFGIGLGIFFPGTSNIVSLMTTNILSADLIYTGYLRDSLGEPYENFARDGVAELDKLHGIYLRTLALQYSRSWRLFRGSIYASSLMGLLNTVKLLDDSNRIYLPIALTLNDKRCTWSGEFLEMSQTGDDGVVGSPYSSAFSTGFGASGFN